LGTMFGKLFGIFSKDIGIDLGTANTLVYVRGKGIVINEPSIVAVNNKTGALLEIGERARLMVGRTPGYIVVSRPLIGGVVSDFEVTEQMLKYFIDKVHEESFSLLPRPRVVIGIPSGVTEVERRAVEDAAANVIIDIGGGSTDIAVISMGGVVAARSLRIAGDKFNEDIIRYLREEKNILIGDATAEAVKLRLGSAYPLDEELHGEVRGRDLVTGLPKELTLTSEEIRHAISRSIRTIILDIKATIEETPPELIADLLNRSVYLSGGGSLMRGLDQLISHEIKLPVKIVEDPLTSVARGCGFVLEHLDKYKDVLVENPKEAYL